MAKGKNFETGPRAAKPTLGARWVGLLTRHRVPAVVLSVLALGALSIPVLDMRLGQPDDSTAAPQETNRKAYDLLVDGFGPGFNGPLTIVVDAGAGESAKVAAAAVAAEFGQLEDVVDVGTPVAQRRGRHRDRLADAAQRPVDGGDEGPRRARSATAPTRSTASSARRPRDGPDRRQHRLRRAAVRRADPVPGR